MARRYVRWTKESLEPVVQVSFSIRQVLFNLGLRETGGSYSNIKSRILEYDLDTSHFSGQGHRKGKKALNRLTADEVLKLYLPSEPKIQTDRLRRALDELDVPRKCTECGGGETWNGKPLRLQIDHINGRRWDNRKENLRYVCPNCHTQTDTYGIKNKNNTWGSIPTAEEIGREPIQ